MISQDLLTKIRSIEIHTRRLLSGTHIGDYSTAVKGSGLEFDQIREYQAGDDVRFIDWNSSARMNKMLVRQYLEERNRNILLLVDTSSSTKFGSTATLKSELMAQIASVLALVADYGKDTVGVAFYGENVEQYMPPARGRKHVHALMQSMFERAEKITPTKNISPIAPTPYRDISQLIHSKHKNSIVFIISDFIDTASSIELIGKTAKHSQVIAIRCLDSLERQFPEIGILAMHEQNNIPSFFDMSTRGNKSYNTLLQERLAQQNKLFKKYNIDLFEATPGVPFMSDLIGFFRKRMMY